MWAISGSDAYGDVAFTPQTTIATVTHAEMETFVRDAIAAIRAESNLPVTVGSAAAKWPRAWTGVDVDFFTIDIYDWINMQWPYSASASELGLMGKPVVVGEFPVNGLTGVPYSQMVESWYGNGYAGASGGRSMEAAARRSAGRWGRRGEGVRGCERVRDELLTRRPLTLTLSPLRGARGPEPTSRAAGRRRGGRP